MAKGKKVISHERNTRVACICRVRSARMLYHGVDIGILSEESNDAGEFDWVIKPNWENVDKINNSGIDWVQIPGIDMDLRLEEYVRRYIPVIVEQRTFPDGRENLYEELQRFGLTYNDKYEVMVRNHGLCGNNDILMERIEEG